MTSGASILIVEDEPDILELIQYNLERAGYSVRCASEGEEGLALALAEPPALVILDLMLPRLSGLELCRRLRASERTRSVGVIMVTAKGQDKEIVAGLEAGADDYLPKPFGIEVLLARVKALLRRAPVAKVGQRFVREGLEVDIEGHHVTIQGEAVSFTATEFRLLCALVARPGRVLTRDQLIDHAIGCNAVVLGRNVDVHIGAVRKKLGPYRDLLETVRGVGYRFRQA